MADQGKWFKLWNSAIEDADLENLELEDWARWAKLGAYIKAHGTDGKVRFPFPFRKLLDIFRTDQIEHAKMILQRFPNVYVGEREVTVTSVTNVNVTLEIEYTNWLKYQGDFSGDRVRKFRDKKRHHVTAQEEKRSRRRQEVEEKRKETPPFAPPIKFLNFVYLTPDEHQKLTAQLGGRVSSYLSRLDGYIGQIGEAKAKTKYKSHYHTILNWHRKDVEEGKINGTDDSQSPTDFKALARSAREAKRAREETAAGTVSGSNGNLADVQHEDRGSARGGNP